MCVMSAGHAVAETLAQLGVRHVFGLAGSCMIEILDGMYGREELHFLTVRHEQSAALMADGFGRMTGRPGVCMATNGPGATNLVTGVANAMLAQSPVIVITGAPMMKDMFQESVQEIDQVAMFRPLVKWSVQVRKPERTADVIREAYETATSGVPGPVHVDLPRDVLNDDVELPCLDDWRERPRIRPAPDPKAVASAAALLKEAERPLLLAGGGVLWAEASRELVALAEALDAPIMTSTGRDDVAPNSYPLFLGSIGRGTGREAKALFQEADIVFAVGTRLAHSTTFLRPDFFGPETKLIHAAVEPRTVGRFYPVAVGMVADADLALKAILRAVGESKARPAWHERAEEVRRAQEQHREACSKLDRKPIDPRRAHMALAKVLPKDAILTTDAGSACGYIYELQRFERPRSLLAPQDLAAIGVGYPVGLGAKLACPDRPTVTISGDGAFLCNGAEIETAVREKLHTLCVILNNFNYGSERAYQRYYYEGRYIGDQIGNPAFDEYARAFGAMGYRVTDPLDLEDTFAEALRQDAPVLVDVICDPDVFPEPRRKEAVKKK
ncbi:MAG: thiamine pyrophosphate-binding protein [Candidatus Methylomirabilales bacterium]